MDQVIAPWERPRDGRPRAAATRRGAGYDELATAIVVWDGQDPILAKTVKALEKELGDEIWVVDPAELG